MQVLRQDTKRRSPKHRRKLTPRWFHACEISSPILSRAWTILIALKFSESIKAKIQSTTTSFSQIWPKCTRRWISKNKRHFKQLQISHWRKINLTKSRNFVLVLSNSVLSFQMHSKWLSSTCMNSGWNNVKRSSLHRGTVTWLCKRLTEFISSLKRCSKRHATIFHHF